jgi:hypothetical protein
MNIIGIYPGSFQPPHRGHFNVYLTLKKITGNNTFIAVSEKVELPKSPLTFEDKQQLWVRHGVPIDKVIKVKNPTSALEITKKFGADRTSVVFSMTKNEAEQLMASSNGYYEAFQSIELSKEPLNKKAYILIVPNETLNLNGQLTTDAFQKVMGSQKTNIEQKKQFFKQVFGWYDISLFDLVHKKFSEASSVKERVSESLVLRRILKPIVKEIMGQLAQPSGQPMQSMQSTQPLVSPEDAAKAARDQKDKHNADLKDRQKELDFLKKKDDIDKKMNKQKITNTQSDIQNLKSKKI